HLFGQQYSFPSFRRNRMVLSKRVVGLCLFILLLSQSTRVNYAQELAASPSPSPQETPTPASDTKPTFESAFARLEWRSIGPANMGGRTADVEGVPGNANIFYVATASGGLWKTINAGTTW